MEHTGQNQEQKSDHKVYRFRNQVEGVNSVKKRKFSGINNSRSTTLQNKGNKT